MAEPVRNDESLGSLRWRGSLSSPPDPLRTETEKLLPADTPSRPLGEWPHGDITEAAAPEGSGDRRLRDAGEAVGTAIGTVVSEARNIPGRLQDGVQNLKHRLRVIAGQKSQQVQQRATELAGEAKESIAEAAERARRQEREWETSARYYANSYPFQFIAGAAAAGFAIGFLLRLWRDE